MGILSKVIPNRLLMRLGARMTRNDPLSQVVQSVNKSSILPGRCGVCGESFKYPSRTVFLPWQPPASTIDVGSFCKRCDRAVCQRHVGTSQWTVAGKTGWSLKCGTCGTPLLGAMDIIEGKTREKLSKES